VRWPGRRRQLHEDWAIGLTDGLLSDLRGADKCNAASKSSELKYYLPTREAVEELARILGREPVVGTERSMPRVGADVKQQV
jgi:hypothetical protein